jgi:hypothetical protein
MNDEDPVVEALIDVQEKMAEVIHDEITMYFGEGNEDKELAWFITDAINESYVVLPSVDSIDAAVTIYFSQQSLEDLFHFCREKGLNMQEFVQELIKDAIYR